MDGYKESILYHTNHTCRVCVAYFTIFLLSPTVAVSCIRPEFNIVETLLNITVVFFSLVVHQPSNHRHSTPNVIQYNTTNRFCFGTSSKIRSEQK